MRTITFVATAVIMLALSWSAGSASGPREEILLFEGTATPGGARAETLWIFDADFEDLIGDNAGWTTYDRTGTLAVPNHWHKDTIRINGFGHLGDSTWWCGTYDGCWRQPRGYGNDWTCTLEREFPEVATGTEPGDVLTLEYDQRYAIEKDYDYGYVDVSTDGGDSWTTVHTVTNPGFVGTPGISQDWDSIALENPGHMVIDLNDYAGTILGIRFRFESDSAYSSQDQHDEPGHPVLDGAWQLDNIKLWTMDPDSTTLFYDDCESPGSNGWAHGEVPASGQVGVVFERRYESFGGRTGWMMAAYDTTAGSMIDGQSCLLRSPPIDVSGALGLVGRWEGWFDLTSSGDDLVALWLASSDIPDCLKWQTMWPPVWGATYGGPFWIEIGQEWNSYAGNDWLGLLFDLWNDEPSPTHGVGFVLDRVRIGVPVETGVPDVVASRVALGRAHPSPFGYETTLAYSIPTTGHVTARVIDVAGRVVRTLVDRSVEQGEHSLVWDGRTDSGERAASGVYFVRLESFDGSRTEEATRKLILLY
jgi:hypothetical protein